MNDLLNDVIVALLGVLLTAVVAVAGTWIATRIREHRLKMGREADATLHNLVRDAVLFAEQVGLVEQLAGAAKKILAMQKVKQWLAEKKIPLDAERVSDLIEVYVIKLFNQAKEAYEEDFPTAG